MSLQNLIKQYVRKVEEVEQLIESRDAIEEKIKVVSTGKMNLKEEISGLFLPSDNSTITLLLTTESKPMVVQINLGCHADHKDFLTFCEATPIEEFETKFDC